MSWICTILATLKFQEILLPEPPFIPSLPPSKSYYIAPSQTPIQYNLGMLLLPPWQRGVVNLEGKYQNTTQKKILDSDSNVGSSVDLLESTVKDTEMIINDDIHIIDNDVGKSEIESTTNDDVIEEDNIVDKKDEDEEDIGEPLVDAINISNTLRVFLFLFSSEVSFIASSLVVVLLDNNNSIAKSSLFCTCKSFGFIPSAHFL